MSPEEGEIDKAEAQARATEEVEEVEEVEEINEEVEEDDNT